MKPIRRLTTLLLICCFSVAHAEMSTAGPKNFLPPLPYPQDALQPFISDKTLYYHYEKHHKGYAEALSILIKAHNMSDLSLEDIIKKSHDDHDLTPVFNAAAQTWNHSFYWASMKPHGGGQPTGAIKELINDAFGDYETFKTQFIEAGKSLFGSGWVWLTLDQNHKLKIVATNNADLPLVHDQKALLTCDVWEHAYYLDFQNRRKDYVEIFLDHLVNWDFANQNLEK
jgi:superoxide dismutase, Fe-Mn family